MESLTWNNQEYKIHRDHQWHFNENPRNYTLVKDSKTFVLTDLGFFDPRLHKEFGFTTFNSMIKWWTENRAKIKAQNGSTNYSEIKYRFGTFFWPLSVYLEDSLEQMKRDLYGYLNTPSLTIQISGRTISGSNSFLLYTPEEVEVEDPVYYINSFEKGVILLKKSTGRGSSVGSASRDWTDVMNYTFRMEPDKYKFFRSVNNEQNYFFGLELEVSTKLSAKEIQAIVTEVEPKQEPFFIFKQDSTLSGKYNNYVEIVTVPCSPRYLRKNFKIFFQKLNKLCKEKNMSISDVFDTSRDLNNGIHIHVSRDDFCFKHHVNRYLAAWNQWDDQVMKLFQEVSQRPGKYSESRWCKQSQNFLKTKPKSKFKLAKFKRASAQKSIATRLKGVRAEDRYCIINQENSATLETRIFQGIFDLSHIMQCISFNEAMLDFTAVASYSQFDDKFVESFHKFIEGKVKYKSICKITEKLVA